MGTFLIFTIKLPIFPPGSFLSYHREAASLPTRKLHHFPLGSFLPTHREVPYFPLTRSFFLFPTGSFPLRNLITSHQEAFSPLTGKLRSYLLPSLFEKIKKVQFLSKKVQTNYINYRPTTSRTDPLYPLQNHYI